MQQCIRGTGPTLNSFVFYIVTQTKLCILFLSELRQISTNFNKFWYADGKVAEIV